MKKILMIGTGGTIASEMTPEGLTPELNTHQLLAYLPRIAQLCHVDCIQLYSLDSTSIHPTHWLGTAQAIREHYDDYDGFVISHGTDTMAYTAAALSYLVQDSPKPIILTGAQKPIWFDGTDSKRNLTDAQQRRHPCGEPSAPGRSPVGAGVALGDADRLLHHLLG